MSNPTTPFNWQMPTNTDLVTDLPADFEVFGQAVATSMADLLGGTTGQILSKNSNTDMDFVWIANDQGDITGVTATSPLTGGGTSGAITVGIQASSTTQSGAVQLTDSTSSTSTTTAATPNSVKTSYDLAAAAVPKSTVTTAGDVIYATGSSAVTRLGIGSAGQVLTVASGVPSWATPAAASSGLTLISTTTLTASGSFNINNCFSSTYDDYMIQIDNLVGSTSSYLTYGFRTGSTNSSANYKRALFQYTYANTNQSAGQTTTGSLGSMDWGTTNAAAAGAIVRVNGPFLSKATNCFVSMNSETYACVSAGIHADATSYESMWFTLGGGTVTGSIKIYGMAK